MKNLLILSLLSLFTMKVSAQEPIYNFNFYHQSSSKKKNEDVKNNANSVLVKTKHDQKIDGKRSEKSRFNSAILDYQAAYFTDSAQHDTFRAGITKNFLEQDSLQWLIQFNWRQIYNGDETNIDDYADFQQSETVLSGNAFGVLIGFHQGSNINNNDFFGVFHELNAGLYYQRLDLNRYQFSPYEGKHCSSYCRGDTTITDYKKYESMNALLSYKAGLKINFYMFWVLPFYEITYFDEILGDRIRESDIVSLQQNYGLRVELPF